MAFVVVSGAGSTADMSLGQLISSAPESWWNPASIGLPMVLIFVLAIIPGWITEQDPWQRVWAAKNESAQMLLQLVPRQVFVQHNEKIVEVDTLSRRSVGLQILTWMGE